MLKDVCESIQLPCFLLFFFLDFIGVFQTEHEEQHSTEELVVVNIWNFCRSFLKLSSRMEISHVWSQYLVFCHTYMFLVSFGSSLCALCFDCFIFHFSCITHKLHSVMWTQVCWGWEISRENVLYVWQKNYTHWQRVSLWVLASSHRSKKLRLQTT